MAFTRRQLGQRAALTPADLAEVRKCRRAYNQLGFGYQLGFVRLLNRLPQQEPLEVVDELLVYTAVQLDIDANEIERYQARRQTIAEHQPRVLAHLGRVPFGKEQEAMLGEFIFSEAHRIEQLTTLRRRAFEYLDERGVLRPAPYRIARVVGEQRPVGNNGTKSGAKGRQVPYMMTLDRVIVRPSTDAAVMESSCPNLDLDGVSLETQRASGKPPAFPRR